MAIVTLCRSCDTVNRSIIDRCKYCGSQCVEVKYLGDSLIGHDRRNSRDFLIREKKHGSPKTHS